MKNIAFKRAKSSKSVEGSLHPDFITEYADTTLFPEGFHKPEDGFEILSEDMFQIELGKNENLHKEFTEKRLRDEQARFKAQESVQKAEKAAEREEMREYQEFLKWKQMKKGK